MTKDINRQRKQRKIFKAFLGILLSSIVSLIIAFLLTKHHYRNYYRMATKEFEVPGLNESFVPQGLDYSKEYDSFVISGYLSNNNETRVYTVNKEHEYKQINIVFEDGSIFKNHAGGISIYKDFVYIAGCDRKVYVISLMDMMSGNDVAIRGRFETGNNATFLSVKDEYLYVGEYYHDLKYSTDKAHHITTPSGDSNKALMYAFKLDYLKDLGVENNPSFALSIQGRIQGMNISEDQKLVLSASSIFEGSQLYVYDFKTALDKNNEVFIIYNKNIPLYYLDSSVLIKQIEILPKAEGIVFKDNRLYMIYESATNRFKYGKLFDAQYAYSMDLNLEK